MTPLIPLTRDLVLIGGGHSHALVLRMWGMKPLAGVRLTVINPAPTAAYSGMLPGFVAGHYTRGELDIDLVQLGRFAGARVILGAVDHIDVASARSRAILVTNTPGVVTEDTADMAMALMLSAGLTHAADTRAALVPGGPHPYVAPWADAAAGAITTAKETLRDLRVAEVVAQDIDLVGYADEVSEQVEPYAIADLRDDTSDEELALWQGIVAEFLLEPAGDSKELRLTFAGSGREYDLTAELRLSLEQDDVVPALG